MSPLTHRTFFVHSSTRARIWRSNASPRPLYFSHHWTTAISGFAIAPRCTEFRKCTWVKVDNDRTRVSLHIFFISRHVSHSITCVIAIYLLEIGRIASFLPSSNLACWPWISPAISNTRLQRRILLDEFSFDFKPREDGSAEEWELFA